MPFDRCTRALAAVALTAALALPAAASTPTGYVQENGAWVASYSDNGDATAQNNVAYQGGTTMGETILEVIFWGSAWQTAGQSPSESAVTAAMTQLLQSTYLAEMHQYGMIDISLRGVLDVTSDPPTNYSQGDIDNLIWGMIGQGTFPNPMDAGGHIIFMVFMPKGTIHPSGIGGEHSDPWRYDFHASPLSFTQRAWTAWVANGSLDSMTTGFGHELVEAISDPEGGAWLMDQNYNRDGDEIADACDNARDRLNGIAVQGYWSQDQHACVIPFPAPPQLQTIYPNSANPWGGDTIHLYGSGFDTGGATSVSFGGTPAESVNCPDANDCYAVAPGGTGTVDVTVKVNDFTTTPNSNTELTYMPSVTGVSPNHGKPGDTITVYGLGLLPGATAKFGPYAATYVNCSYPPGCQVTVPSGAATQDIQFYSLNAWTRPNSSDLFTFDAPTITSVSPPSGPMAGGTEVTITGTGFDTNNDNGMQVLFGGVPAPLVSCYPGDWCNVYTPAVYSAGTVPVTVSVYGSQSSPSNATFTFNQFPVMQLFEISQTTNYAGTGVVAFDGDAAGAVVQFQSSDPSVIQIPAETTVGTGSSSASVPIVFVPSPKHVQVVLTAEYNGVQLEQTISVDRTPPLALYFDYPILNPDTATTGTVAMLEPAPAGGAEVAISASGSGATFPRHVKIPENQYSATFQVSSADPQTLEHLEFTVSYAALSAQAALTISPFKPPNPCPGPACN